MSTITSSIPSSSTTSIHHPSNPNAPLLTRYPQSAPSHLNFRRVSALRLCTAASDAPPPPSENIIRNVALSSVLLLGLGLGVRRFPASAAANFPTRDTVDTEKREIQEDVEAADMMEAFEKWKSKTYALTVPLRIVALRSSFPPVWFQDFVKSQGKRVRLKPEYRQSLNDIVSQLRTPLKKGVKPKSSLVTADLVTLGDSWLSSAIKEGLIDPIEHGEEQEWFQDLTDEWKGYLRRSSDGRLDPQGQVWAAPYRLGSLVIAYKKSKFERHKLAPIEDWADLWRPELAGKITMVDSPREIVGAVLKSMGASYNTHNITSQVAGGKDALLEKLVLLTKQVRLFDSKYYLKAFGAGDVWVAVGWSGDILPAARRMSNVAVIVPKSGASLWADLWIYCGDTCITMDKSQDTPFNKFSLDSFGTENFLWMRADDEIVMGCLHVSKSDHKQLGLLAAKAVVILSNSKSNQDIDFDFNLLLQAIPATSKIKVEEVGGRVRGPSPLVTQWIEFCLQYARALSFKEEAIPGASPGAFKSSIVEPDRFSKGRPKLETNLIAGVPPREILDKCEFLEPLPEETLADYRWLIDSIHKPDHSFLKVLQHNLLSVFQLLPKLWE